MGSSIEQKEVDKEKWDMRTYIRSLSTRADMDQYVHRLEKSYKKEIQELKISTKNTQEKMGILDTKVIYRSDLHGTRIDKSEGENSRAR